MAGIQAIKLSPGATWLITFKVEQDFLNDEPEATVVVRSHQRHDVDPNLAGCLLSVYLDAGVGERWLVLGEREVGLVIPNTRWSQPVPATGLDAALLKRLRALRALGGSGETKRRSPRGSTASFE